MSIPSGILRLTASQTPSTPSGPTMAPDGPEHEPPPEWMGEAAAAHWRRLRPDVAKGRALRESERMALVLTCEALAKWEQATAIVRAEGLTVQGERGRFVAHPASRVADTAWSAALKGLAQLGKLADAPPKSELSRFFRSPQ